MTLEVWTARISTKDPDAFDVTRKSGNKVFAPSWKILKPLLDIRRSGRTATEEEWRTYARAYLQEMAFKSSRLFPDAWAALQARERVVLTCYCTNPERCHRTLLGRLLAHFGADYKGELSDEAHEDLREGFQIAMEMGED